jgi:rhamnogalacturonyl hydrolase YesR
VNKRVNNIKKFHRRDFIRTFASGSLVAAGTGTAFSCVTHNTVNENDLVEKVRCAMLSMQRAPWEQGVAMQACWESGDFEMAYLMAKEAVLRQGNDGRLSMINRSFGGVTDPAAAGEVVFRMAEKYGEKDLSDGHKKMLDYLLNVAPRSGEGVLYHTLKGREFWIDSMYMAPPYLSVAGHPEEAVRQIKGLHRALWNEEKRLYSHRWDDANNDYINEKFWGVGNGWAMASFARVIDSLPESMNKEKNDIIQYAKENIEGCLTHLRPDGLFHNIIDDGQTFIETNLSQMVAYTIYRGIKSGWLSETYFEKAERMREAVHMKVDQHGFVQDVCGAPGFNRPGRATEGQAFFILMESARRGVIQNI